MHNIPAMKAGTSRILLVEDVDAFRLYLRLALEQNGFQVLEASNLDQARRLLRAGTQITSVVLDLDLPDGHGLDIISEIPPGVPVAALSADDSRETELRCHEACCVAILSKKKRLRDLVRDIAMVEQNAPKTRYQATLNPQLASQYVSYLCEARIELQHARSQHDYSSIRSIAHKLRGTAVHFGYSGIGASARALGSAIKNSNIAQIESALDTLVERLMDAAIVPQSRLHL